MEQQIDILAQYADAVVAVKRLGKEIARQQEKLQRYRETDCGLVSDVVSRGRRRSRTLGTLKITGFRTEEYLKAEKQLQASMVLLDQREEELYQLLRRVEDFIEGIDSIEIRNILSFRYVEDMTWAQVAYAMNAIYKNRRYTKECCEKKYKRYFAKMQK